MVDRVYRSAWPEFRRTLLRLRSEFSKFEPSTDWVRLRVDPLLEHLKLLERLVHSWESYPLRGAVPMLHSDLVYFRDNVNGLKQVLASERKRLQARRKAR
jgi:hypothetical protein